MSEQPTNTGLIFSGALHAALLACVLVGFASAPRFDDAAESIPVETITQSQFNQIMKGERDAKPAKLIEQPPAPKTIAAAAPTPPAEPAKAEPPPALKHIDEAQPAPEPPARPEPQAPAPPPKPEAAKPAPTPPEPDNAEVIKPKPVAEAKTAPEPPTRPKTPDKPREPAPEKPKVDVLARLVDKTKTDEQPKPPARNMDLNAIAKIIGAAKSAPEQQSASATPQGSPTQNAPRMSPSLSAALDGWLTEAYLRCWSLPPTTPEGDVYVPILKVAYNADGSLQGQPVLVNPPSDRAWTAYAESARRAVLKCNPLHVPPQYALYYEQWRTKSVHFDPRLAQQ